MSAVVLPFPVAEMPAKGLPLCAEHDGSWWFTEAHYEQAKGICEDCELRERCLDVAFTNRERLGVWGGMTPAERDRVPDAVVVPLRVRRRHRVS